MVTLEYRLVGSVTNPALTKVFETRELAMAWARDQGNVLILSIESSGAAAMSRIFG